ncbi:MAG: hypothetical protein A3G24_27085 [Betaproteobacteria bacterium RIFCSPLOWO2_12_FULL_62_13]|nr:MAG: hypothetical protein A3G24_27085 [Betaproteobacteria bacterium RIFCSPLOWO2_12_FULL_62_13]
MRVRTNQDGQYKVPALLVLSEIASSLSTDATVDELLARYLSTMVRIAGARAGAVRVLTGDGKHLRLVSAVGIPDAAVERERIVPIDCGACGEAVRGGAALWGHTAEHCREVVPDGFLEDCDELVAVPLKRGNTVLGVYNLFLRRGAKLANEVRILFAAISEHLGIALENARLSRENARITLVNERQLLANQVHDALAQTLAYARMRAAALREAQRGGDSERAGRYLSELEDAIDTAYNELRELIGGFRQPMDPRGLVAALEASLEAFRNRSGALVQFANRASDMSLSPEEEMHVFHIVQEALANACKHAKAKTVRLSIDLVDDRCRVCVEDDGIGFAPGSAEDTAHFGLSIMRERARRLGGEVLIDSSPGAGARVCLSFPARNRVHQRHESPQGNPG